MEYISLYRKYRPTTFNEVVGQEIVVKILQNSILNNKISHAYLFSGPRGTGKTSIAKIFSKAINCLNNSGDVCNNCDVCNKKFDELIDIVEIDAASNNGVDEIREIRNNSKLLPSVLKYKVYIVDEVHMLSTSAFNALLKTLEEPPKHVIFILATTEKHKIPVTILSRCLRFDFDRLSEKNISDRLKYICNKENIKYEDAACEYMAKLADGALRDGISILDRCISEMDEVLKLEDVRKIVGAIDEEVLKGIQQDIYDYNIIDCIEKIDQVIIKGKDLRELVSNLNERFLNTLISEKDNEKKTRTINIIDRLSKLDNDLRNSAKPDIVLKSTIVELCNTNTGNLNTKSNNADNNIVNALNKKIENLEREIIALKNNPSVVVEKQLSNTQIVGDKKIEKKEDLNITSADKVEIQDMNTFKYSDEFKKFILSKGNIKIYSSIASAKMYFKDDILAIITSNSFAYNLLNDVNNIEIIKNNFKERYNKDIVVKIGLDETKQGKELKIEEFFKEKNVNYTSID